MMQASLPPDEARRLQLLSDLAVLDTPPEEAYDALTQAAQQVTGWPIALISLVDAQRQWFKSHQGLSSHQTPREHSFCAHALNHRDTLFEVPDAMADPRFADNPLVAGEPHIRAYAGQTLAVQGVRLGTLCLIHRAPAALTAAQRTVLAALAQAASALLTERLHRTQALLASARLADFGAASGDWLWETDADHRLIWLSGNHDVATGWPAASRLGRPLPNGRLLDARGAPMVPALTLHELCAQRRPFSRATVCVPGPLGPRWWSLSAVPIAAGASTGAPQGLRGTVRDVTAQVRAEQARDAEAQRLRRLVSQVPGALYEFRMDAMGHASFPYATAPLETMFEVTAAQAMVDAQPIFERVHPDDLPGLHRSIERSRTALSPWQAAFRVRLPGVGERHLSAHSSPRREPDGSVLWHGLVTDVTAQVQQQRERERLQRERDRAQREARARADALSRVSHELRTPLNAILGFTQLMQAAQRDGETPSGRDERWAEWVQQIHRAGSHLLALVNDVLDACSLQARRFAVDLKSVDVAQLVQETAALVQAQAQLRGQQLVCQHGADLGGGALLSVRADKRGLRQVLLNLLGNAIKYTAQGGRVELRWQLLDGRRLMLEVCDNGPGISAEDQARLFKPFERGIHADGVTPGTGLGLMISQQLVRAMGGELGLRSSPGQGSVFTVTLPLAEPDESPQPRARSGDSLFGSLVAQPPSAESAALPNALLLYVEDDPVNGLLMQEFVVRMPPLRLHLAVTLADGLLAARRLQPDLVLLDLNLPDGSGIDLLRQLRADPLTAKRPVVALSADALPAQQEQAMAAGFDDYWTKPVDFALLRKRLGALLGT